MLLSIKGDLTVKEKIHLYNTFLKAWRNRINKVSSIGHIKDPYE